MELYRDSDADGLEVGMHGDEDIVFDTECASRQVDTERGGEAVAGKRGWEVNSRHNSKMWGKQLREGGRETLTMMTGRKVQGKSISEEEAAEIDMETAEAYDWTVIFRNIYITFILVFNF